MSERFEFLHSNPISQSFSCLANNLTKLNYYSFHPLVHQEYDDIYEETSNCRFNNFKTSTSSSSLSLPSQPNTDFGIFLACYYTMGAFELKTILFENSFQILHESKLLDQEFAQVFSARNDSIDDEWKTRMIESLGCSSENFAAMYNLDPKMRGQRKLEQMKPPSKWQTSPDSSTVNHSVAEEPVKSGPLFETIFKRIKRFSTSNLFDLKTLDGAISVKDLEME